MLLAISRYTRPLTEVDQHRPAHWAYLKHFFDNEKLLVAGRQKSGTGGVIIAATLSHEEFKTILDNDPFTQAGIAEYTIFEITPSFHHPGLDFLLK